jgi:hypothetical protein
MYAILDVDVLRQVFLPPESLTGHEHELQPTLNPKTRSLFGQQRSLVVLYV